MLDYRGYGRSEGEPSEEGMYRDAVAAWEFLVHEKGIAASHIVAFGQSLGTPAACELALRRVVAGVILEAPLSSAGDMARKVLPFAPIGWALRSKLDTAEKVSRLQRPLLVVHGTEDGVVPYSQGEHVYRAARDPKRFVRLNGAGHNDLWIVAREAYLEAIRDYLASLSPVPGG
jgi:hypothetical protein